MPLVQITGLTAVNTTFNVCLALMKDEKQESYQWALQQLQQHGRQRHIRSPLVIISDYDNAFRLAPVNVFPETASQLCVWHVMKNVAYHIEMKWQGSLEGTQLGRAMAARGGQRREDDEEANAEPFRRAGLVANGLVDLCDRQILGGIQLHPGVQPQPDIQLSDRHYANDADGLLQAWHDVVYAATREEYDKRWTRLQNEFRD